MKRVYLPALLAILCASMIAATAANAATAVQELVDAFKNATDVQRQELQQKNAYAQIQAAGIITDVKAWDKFDEKTTTRIQYYKVTTAPQQTANHASYTVSFYYRSIDAVQNLHAGSGIDTTGTLLNIADNVGTISVSLYGETLTPEDKVMFQNMAFEGN